MCLHIDNRFLPSESWDIAIGNKFYNRFLAEEGGEYSGSGYYPALVSSVGKELADFSQRSDLPFAFTVTHGSTNNATCLPGGKIFIQISLIENMFQTSDSFDVGCFSLREKIAGIIAHEISHATLRHTARERAFMQMFELAGSIVGLAACFFLSSSITYAAPLIIVTILIDSCAQAWFARGTELEADEETIYTLDRAGYDPKIALWVDRFFEVEGGYEDGRIKDHFMRFFKQLTRVFNHHPDRAQRTEIDRQTIAKMPKPEIDTDLFWRFL